jgi:translation initiation factor 5
MTTLNIAGLTDVTDFSYRYKMPAIQAKVEGRGNGIKTVLPNIIELSLSLNREAPEITKFFGCELGSQTSFDIETGRAIVNGAISASDLQNHLRRYIENFVLCKNCRLPETTYKIKNDIITQKCAACGEKASCDMSHKLATFILAQHKKKKDEEKIREKEKEKKEKKEKKAARAALAGGASPSDDADESSGRAAVDDSEGASERKEKKEKKEKKDKKDKKERKEKGKAHGADDGADESEELVVADLEEEEEKAAIGKIIHTLKASRVGVLYVDCDEGY